MELRNRAQIIYRDAGPDDVSAIASLHALSWQQHYRGMISAAYLENEVVEDRLRVWHKRLNEVPANQKLILAEAKGQLCGFSCVYLNDHPKWGALIDNLHVAKDWQGQGLGKMLLQKSATCAQEQVADTNLYLFVLEKNKAAIQFYERMNGIHQEVLEEEVPGGDRASVIRYVWTNLHQLIQL